MLSRMEGLMTIGEFSAKTGLSPRRLRAYAELGLVVPAAVDGATGYRFYDASQVWEATLIDALRGADMPLADIAVFVRDPSSTRLDAWARRVEEDAAHRCRRIGSARRMLLDARGSRARGTHAGETREGELDVQLEAVGRTDAGAVRRSNEDAFVVGARCAAVADGIGGAPGGEVASQIAVSLVDAAFTGRSSDELEAGARAANRAIWNRANSRPMLAGMGTTLAAIALVGDDLVTVNVGDSRVCMVRDGSLSRVTEDHTVVAELVLRGELEERDARDHDHFGVLTRALGAGPDVEIDVATCPARVGDRVLVASDGLFNELVDTEICDRLTTREGPDAAVGALMELALGRGARDNVTVVVADLVVATA